jgi:hypothetical protein
VHQLCFPQHAKDKHCHAANRSETIVRAVLPVPDVVEVQAAGDAQSLCGHSAKGGGVNPPADYPPDESENVAERPSFTSVFLSLKEFSALVGMAPNTARDRLEKGLIRGKKSGRLWRIPVTEIERMLG